MGKAILICGKVCSGKTTYAQTLVKERGAILLSCDEITLLFGQYLGDRHNEIVERTEKYLFRKAVELLPKGVNIILDWGFWQKSKRDEATAFFMERGFAVEWHYVQVSDGIWHRNLAERNSGFTGANDDFYFIDDGMADEFGRIFEEPRSGEYDFLYENNR